MSAKRGVRKRQCGRKIKHETKESAIKHAALLMRKDGEAMTVYGPCRWCGKYHVGHRHRDAHST